MHSNLNVTSRTLPLRLLLTISLLFLFWIVFYSQSNAQASAEAIWTFDSDREVRHVETADLNGDYIEDIIAAEYSNTYYGDPSSVFGIDGSTGDTLWRYQIEDGIRSMAIGDLNNDGIMDAAAGASYNASGTPDGKVHGINGTNGAQLWTYPLNTTISAITIGNLNGDAFMDVAVGCFDDFIYAIDGRDGSLLWSREIGSLWINAVDAGDVNGDSIDDIAFANEYLAGFDNQLGVLDGTNGVPIWEQTVNYIVMDVMLDDVDHDGNLEAVFGGISSADIGTVYIKNALDGIAEWDYDVGPVDHSNGDIVLASQDIDEDGDLDLFVGTYLGNHRIYAFDGDINSPMWISDSLDGNVKNIDFGDVTGDKDIEVVAASSDRVEVVGGLNGAKIWYYSVAGSINDVACSDFNNDEIIDVAAGGGSDFSGADPGTTVWALQTIQSPVLWEYNFGEYANAVAVADVNGDNFDDVITVASLGDKATAIDGSSGTLLWEWLGTENLYAITQGDYDHDNITDIAVAGNDEMVTAIKGTTGNLYWQFTNPTDQIYRQCLRSADLNDDGYFEVIAGTDDNNVYAIQTDAKSELWSYDTGGEINNIKLHQMNGTGPIDVVAAVGGGTSGEKVVVIDGSNGSLIWEYLAPASVEHVAVTDSDDNGVPDVIAGITPYGTRQIIAINGLDQTEMWSFNVEIASNVQTIDAGDLDMDKIPDIIIPGSSTDKKVHAVNGFTGAEMWAFETGNEVNCVLVYDVDNDNWNEVIAGSDDQNIYVLDGMTGNVEWSYSCADDVMDIGVGDISGDGLPNIACVTFGSDGIAYAFKSLAVAPSFICGDANSDELVNLLDITYLIAYLYSEGPPPDIMDSADVNNDGAVNLLDITYLIEFLYKEGPDPDCP